MSTPTKVEITIDAIGRGRIVVDGVDLSMKVAGFVLKSRIGELTRLRLDYNNVAADAVAEVRD